MAAESEAVADDRAGLPRAWFVEHDVEIDLRIHVFGVSRGRYESVLDGQH